jgi:glyoxylase-like metal-dependent hydrolase (beta-lactamase superfamily II)
MSFSVNVLKMGKMPVPGPEVYWMSHWDEFVDLTFLMVVARDGHNTVVVNTGPPPDLDPLNALWKGFHPSGRVQFAREESERPANALASIGVKPEDVTHVILTPLVAYTCGNVNLFPNAQIIFSRRGWIEDVMAPPYAVHLPRDIFVPPDVLKHLLFDAADRVRLMDNGEVCRGVNVWWAGVHHRSSLAVVIDSQKGKVIASDSFFLYGNVEQNHYLGVGESYAEAMTTYARVRDEADIIVPLYDGAVFDRYSGGVLA